MKRWGLGLLVLTGLTLRAFGDVKETPTGILLDTKWKADLYEYAKKNVAHPSWGIAHSERDYQMAVVLASSERLTLDLDVLFAAAFLHDLGGIGVFEKPGVDHAVRSAELAEPLLRDWGFPMVKFPAVKEMILGHTYYSKAPTSQPAIAFRDADILDFIGVMGITRILAITLEPGRATLVLKPIVDLLKKFQVEMPQKLSLKDAKARAVPRVKEMDEFLKTLDRQAYDGKAL